MRYSNTSDSFNPITSARNIKDIEAHCRKVQAEAVIEFFKILLSVPVKFLQPRDIIFEKNTEN
jgi:hypothetical protein